MGESKIMDPIENAGQAQLNDAGLGTNNSAAAGDNQAGEEKEPSSYYETVMKEKKYANEEELAKAYFHSEKGIKTREEENKKMRDYITKVAPHLDSAKKLYEALEDPKKFDVLVKEYRKAKGLTDPEGGAKEGEKPIIDPAVSDFIKTMIGNEINPIKQDQAAIKSNVLINQMREDKVNFKYLTPEIENRMAAILAETNEKFPTTLQGLKTIYNAAIGENVDKILEAEKDKVTKDNYRTFLSKRNSFTESDLDGAGGDKTHSDNQSAVDDIVNAKY